jgi:uncharacterized membrane protein
MTKGPYERAKSSYTSQYSSLSSSLSLYKGNDNPSQPYNKVFGMNERKLARMSSLDLF